MTFHERVAAIRDCRAHGLFLFALSFLCRPLRKEWSRALQDEVGDACLFAADAVRALKSSGTTAASP
jgi:hypothetical protein